MSISYAKNQLTSVNITLEDMRGDRALWTKPGNYIEKRSSVRTDPPEGMDRTQLARANRHLIEIGDVRVAAISLLCRELGLRRKEAILLDLRLASHQAETLGKVNITAGTKGGRDRSIDRWVPVSHEANTALRVALNVSSPSTKLISEFASLAQWMMYVSKAWSDAAEKNGLSTLRDLRAAYACDRYQQITGHPAPAIMGERTCEKSADHRAREILSQELGHNRIDVLVAYIGSSR